MHFSYMQATVSKIFFIIKKVKKGNWELELLWFDYEGKKRNEVVAIGQVDSREDFIMMGDLRVCFYAEGYMQQRIWKCQEEHENQRTKTHL